MKRFLPFTAAGLLLILTLALPVCAAPAAQVSFGAATVTVGDTVTATVTFTGDSVGGVEANLTYDDAVLEFLQADSENASGGAGSLRLIAFSGASSATSLSSKLKFRAKAAGKATLAIQSSSVYSVDETLLGTPTASGSVTAKSPTPLSANANLKSLTVGPGKLAPAFSKSVTAYTVSVPNETTRLTFSAVAEDADARVSTSGGSNLKVGANTVKITVTAPSGDTKVYTITVTRGEPAATTTTDTTATTLPPTAPTLPYGDPQSGTYLCVCALPEGTSPPGFELSAVTLGDAEYAAYRHPLSGHILLYASEFLYTPPRLYLYDEENGCLYDCLPQGVYLLLPAAGAEDPPAGFTAEPTELGGCVLPFWQRDGEPLPLVYALHRDGHTGFYRYDAEEASLQRYLPAATLPAAQPSAPTDSTPPTTSSGGDPIPYRLVVWIGAPALIGIILLLLVLLRRASRKDRPEPRH